MFCRQVRARTSEKKHDQSAWSQVACYTVHMRSAVAEVGVNGRDKWLHHTVYVRCNYLFLPIIRTSDETRPIYRAVIKQTTWWAWQTSKQLKPHDDVIKLRHFPRYWPLRGASIVHRCIPLTKASGAELWCFLWSTVFLTNGWANNRRWFETSWRSLWRNCNASVSS